MKTYISTGIGDMVFLDSILTLEEKKAISEIYWACRFGITLIPLMENNPDYPNLVSQHTIPDEVGLHAMKSLDPVAVSFWHFRPDFPKNFQTGLKLFNIEEYWNKNELQTIDVISMFMDMERSFVGSSFIKNADENKYGDYILFHYPTSTRPRSDICTISSEDWQFVENLSKENELKVIVVADSKIEVPLTNFELLINPDIKSIVSLSAHCKYYAGCDSFCAHLATKVLKKENLFIKSHNPKIKEHITTTSFFRHFCPHPKEDIAEFYKSYIGYP